MALSEHLGSRAKLRRAAGLVLAAAVAAGSLSVGVESANAATSGRSGQVRWAMTASGRLAAVDTVFPATPVHPEAITHPNADAMGSAALGHLTPTAAGPAAAAVHPDASVPQLPGIDVSDYQGDVNWASVSKSIDFSYAKATEGTYYTNAYFAQQYNGPYEYGVIRGAYHFGIPSNSSGQAQAEYFIDNGGGWSDDGKTLPGALDIEYNPYGAECYGLTQSQMVTWIANFVNEYASLEHVYPVIYSTTDWWSTCTGNYSGFAAKDPLWIANYSAGSGGTLPAGWGYYTFWQYASSGSLPGDQDVFNGALSGLQGLATRG
jgi:GH25 family lysozyme M1 (1,4-beta-N-acetylmuramidase)